MFDPLPALDFAAAAARIADAVQRTPLQPLPSPDPRIELRGKLENRQATGAFKARGAANNIARLDDAQRAAGVVATRPGNPGKALAWAARRAGGAAGHRAGVERPERGAPERRRGLGRAAGHDR